MAYNPPIGSIYHLYTTYILPSGGLYATHHLLREPETTIELTSVLGAHPPSRGNDHLTFNDGNPIVGIYVPWSKVAILGTVIPPLIGILMMGI